MTRGQDGLGIDLDQLEAISELKRQPLPQDLKVRRANEAEEAAHREYLVAIEKAAKKPPIWQ
jgi:DNA polymerase-3 subunit epsilon